MNAARICTRCGGSFSDALEVCPEDSAPLFAPEIVARVGMLLKDHQIEGVIGEGGMGVVYRARHVVLEKPVAIKVLHDRFAGRTEAVEQFIIEAKAASRIRHPNIIDVTDIGVTPEGLVFLVMEYLEGETLEDRLRRVHRLSLFDTVNIFVQVVRGLGAAHELGIVHRDLKPANIFLLNREGRRQVVRRSADATGVRFDVEPEGTYAQAKLLDFGVAKFLDRGPSAATQAGAIFGTPYYLSPEQAQEKPADARSDIYSLGAVLYETITGAVPFTGDSMLEVLNGHVVGKPVPPSRRAPDAGIDARTDAVVLKCLAKKPEDRFASADELGEALRDCVSDRAFLRDAERLPGIRESGFDLSRSRPSARRGSPSSSGDEGPADGTAIDDRPMRAGELADSDMLGSDRFPHTQRIRGIRPRSKIPLLAGAVLVTLVGVGLVLLLARQKREPDPPAAALVAVAASKAAALAPAALAPVPIPSAPSGPNAAPAPSPAPSLASPLTPLPLLGPQAPPGLGKGPLAHRHPGAELDRRATVALPPSHPTSVPAVPDKPAAPLATPAEPPAQAAAPAPAEPARAAGNAGDLLREAQQAWIRHHYAVAIDKARSALAVSPDEQLAYQIIAVCSCAINNAEDAKQASKHLDPGKRRLVKSLCEKDGTTLDIE